MTTAADIINAALANINIPTDVAHNDQEMLRLLNQALDEIDNDNMGEK